MTDSQQPRSFPESVHAKLKQLLADQLENANDFRISITKVLGQNYCQRVMVTADMIGSSSTIISMMCHEHPQIIKDAAIDEHSRTTYAMMVAMSGFADETPELKEFAGWVTKLVERREEMQEQMEAIIKGSI